MSSSTRGSVTSSSLAGIITLNLIICLFVPPTSRMPSEYASQIDAYRAEAVPAQHIAALGRRAQLRNFIGMKAKAVRLIPTQIDEELQHAQNALRDRKNRRPEKNNTAAGL